MLPAFVASEDDAGHLARGQFVTDPFMTAICWFLVLSSRRKAPAPLHFDPPLYCLPMPSICRNRAFSVVSAGLLHPLFSQFSKS